MQPLVSQLFLHFGALPIQLIYLLPSELPSSISSPTPFLVSFLTPFQPDFFQISASQAYTFSAFSFSNTPKEKPKLSQLKHVALLYLKPAVIRVSVVLLLQIWSRTSHGDSAENNSRAYKQGQMFRCTVEQKWGLNHRSSFLPLFGKNIITSPNSYLISTGIGNTDLSRENGIFSLCKNTFTFLKFKVTSISLLQILKHIWQLQCSLGRLLFMEEKALTTI